MAQFSSPERIRPGTTAFRKVYSAATTLTEADSGALLRFITAAGYTFTLPSAVEGMEFEVVTDTTITSVGARVECASGDFMIGTILQGQPTTFTQTARTANGTSHLAISGNGTTTGGIIGDHYWLTAISDTQWEIRGLMTATGSTATPFATS